MHTGYAFIAFTLNAHSMIYESELGLVNPYQEVDSLDCNAHSNSDWIEHVIHLIMDGRHIP